MKILSRLVGIAIYLAIGILAFAGVFGFAPDPLSLLAWSWIILWPFFLGWVAFKAVLIIVVFSAVLAWLLGKLQ